MYPPVRLVVLLSNDVRPSFAATLPVSASVKSELTPVLRVRRAARGARVQNPDAPAPVPVLPAAVSIAESKSLTFAGAVLPTNSVTLPEASVKVVWAVVVLVVLKVMVLPLTVRLSPLAIRLVAPLPAPLPIAARVSVAAQVPVAAPLLTTPPLNYRVLHRTEAAEVVELTALPLVVIAPEG